MEVENNILYIQGKSLHEYEDCKDGNLVKILCQEMRKANLPIDIISLLVSHIPKIDEIMGVSGGSKRTGYNLFLYPEVIKEDYHDSKGLKRVIRHELAHIKYGDCDRRYRTKHPLLNRIFNLLIEEPRAWIYAIMG